MSIKKIEESSQDAAISQAVGDAYAKFMPKVTINKIKVMKQEKGWIYKGVITNYKHIPDNVQKHVDQGYEIVFGTDGFQDDRKFSPNSNESHVPHPIVETSADGYQYLAMRITEEKFKAVKQKEAKDYADRYKRTLKGSIKKGTTFEADGGEIEL